MPPGRVWPGGSGGGRAGGGGVVGLSTLLPSCHLQSCSSGEAAGISVSRPSLRLQEGELENAAVDGQELEGLLRTCPLMPASHLDWLHKVPVLVVLSLNLLFLARIMWVSRRYGVWSEV